ncbi:mediator of RNA polymerase II transcription subunit 19a-like isoform X2 [Durio zibethinus]|uniref:Mediator of RNA polymerase II transcription subunit 19a-like isoform X2 n=1 Tax=Durio zibethinus TaxID=66656 RepID=A0A6P6ABC5_DURZI|nr:mediator of RNA polymerase II transcription subunit 19a-like isoform X2 [Durio zibethinus]
MDFESKKFGRGPKELGGAADLINQFKLWPHHDFFCKRSLPLLISETNYLRNVVGDTEIRKGEGMELHQLFQNASDSRRRNLHIGHFDLDLLGEAFQMNETAQAEKGIPVIVSKSRAESKDNNRKHRKQKDKDKEKDKNKHKHRHSDKNKNKIRRLDSDPEHLKKPQDKKRRYNVNGNLFDVRIQQNGQNPRRIELGKLKMAG